MQCQVIPVYFKVLLLDMLEILLSPLCITYFDAEIFRYAQKIQPVRRVVGNVLKILNQHYSMADGRRNSCTLRTTRGVAKNGLMLPDVLGTEILSQDSSLWTEN